MSRLESVRKEIVVVCGVWLIGVLHISSSIKSGIIQILVVYQIKYMQAFLSDR